MNIIEFLNLILSVVLAALLFANLFFSKERKLMLKTSVTIYKRNGVTETIPWKAISDKDEDSEYKGSHRIAIDDSVQAVRVNIRSVHQ